MTAPRLEHPMLMIPPAGLMEVYAEDESSDQDRMEGLMARGNSGRFVSLNIEVDGDTVGTVEWMVNSIGPINERAREALATLSNVHMIFTGHVLFVDVPADQVYSLVAQLSRKEE